jgi:hypothetical protein
MAKTLDPLHITERTYKQFGRLLDMLEDPRNTAEVTIPQLINALKALQSYDLGAIRKSASEEDNVGSAVRSYSRAFEKNANRGRKQGARTGQVLALADDDPDDASD